MGEVKLGGELETLGAGKIPLQEMPRLKYIQWRSR